MTGKTYPVAYSGKHKLTDSSTYLCMIDSLLDRHVRAGKPAGQKEKIPFHHMVKNRAEAKARTKKEETRSADSRAGEEREETRSACPGKKKSSKPRPSNEEGMTREEKPQTLEIDTVISDRLRGEEQGSGSEDEEKSVFRSSSEAVVLAVHQEVDSLAPKSGEGIGLFVVRGSNTAESVLPRYKEEESLFVVQREKIRVGSVVLVRRGSNTDESALPRKKEEEASLLVVQREEIRDGSVVHVRRGKLEVRPVSAPRGKKKEKRNCKKPLLQPSGGELLQNSPGGRRQDKCKNKKPVLPRREGRSLVVQFLPRLLLLLTAALLAALCAPKVSVPDTPLRPLMPREGIEALAQSIDRSRKRHLEEGLLRGDQALDRLRVQEASASPLLKKTRKSPSTTPPRSDNMAMTMAEFKEYMDSNTNKRLGDIDNKIGGMQAAINDNTVKLDKHEAQISEIRSELVKMKSDFPPLPSAANANANANANPTPAAAMLPMLQQPDEEYLVARRSLRLWPVRGPDLWKSTGTSLVSNLGLEGKIDNDSVEDVSRVQLPSGPGVTDEVLVRFRTANLRDLVMGSASRLGTFIDRDGRATAGMRMEVPTKLQQSFRVLFKYGSNLRARHGPGTRRHVKFCDTDHTLYLNIKLPGDESWSRVSLQVAIRGMRARETINDGQLERRLDITGPFQDARRRATSVSAPPKPTEASAWTRRTGSSTSS